MSEKLSHHEPITPAGIVLQPSRIAEYGQEEKHVDIIYGGLGSVDCIEGVVRFDGRDYVPEPEVFYIDHMSITEAKQGQGLAAPMLAGAFQEARSRGYELARAGLINPRMVNVIEKLVADGRVTEVAYLTREGGWPPVPQPIAQESFQSENRVTAAEAKAFLQQKEVQNAEDGGVDTVIKL